MWGGQVWMSKTQVCGLKYFFFRLSVFLSQPLHPSQWCLGKCLTTNSLKMEPNQTTLSKDCRWCPAPLQPCRCGMTSLPFLRVYICTMISGLAFLCWGLCKGLAFKSIYEFSRGFPKGLSWPGPHTWYLHWCYWKLRATESSPNPIPSPSLTRPSLYSAFPSAISVSCTDCSSYVLPT
jgi:hypothetical protein